MTTFYYAVAVIAVVSVSVSAMSTSQADEIDAVLNQVDSPSFFSSGASDRELKAVRETILGRAQVKSLVERPAESAPRIIQRIEAGQVRHPVTLCAYFLVLEKSGEKAALPVLLNYVESAPRRVGGSTVCAAWHPFRHAVEAIKALMRLDKVLPGDESLWGYMSLCGQMSLRRDEIVSWARELLEQDDRSDPFGDIELTLDRIDRAGFGRWVGVFQSDYVHVCEGILTAPEVRYLVARCSESVPRVVQRIEQGRVKNPGTLSAYFPILQQCGDKAALPVLLDYVESLPASEYKKVGTTGHPFNCAVEVIYALADLGPFPPRTEPSTPTEPGVGLFRRMFLDRHDMVARARAVLQDKN